MLKFQWLTNARTSCCQSMRAAALTNVLIASSTTLFRDWSSLEETQLRTTLPPPLTTMPLSLQSTSQATGNGANSTTTSHTPFQTSRAAALAQMPARSLSTAWETHNQSSWTSKPLTDPSTDTCRWSTMQLPQQLFRFIRLLVPHILIKATFSMDFRMFTRPSLWIIRSN